MDRVLRCRRCGKIMHDSEPYSTQGEHWHSRKEGKPPCVNDNKCFRSGPRGYPLDLKETEDFKTKSERRAITRVTGKKPRRAKPLPLYMLKYT